MHDLFAFHKHETGIASDVPFLILLLLFFFSLVPDGHVEKWAAVCGAIFTRSQSESQEFQCVMLDTTGRDRDQRIILPKGRTSLIEHLHLHLHEMKVQTSCYVANIICIIRLLTRGNTLTPFSLCVCEINVRRWRDVPCRVATCRDGGGLIKG